MGGNVTTFAGSGIADYQDGPPASARFSNLGFLKCDVETNLYVGDCYAVRKIAADGTVSTLALNLDGAHGFSCAMGLCVDVSNMIYAATEWGTIFQISPAGVPTLFAGSSAGYNDGPRLNALFFSFFNFNSIGRDTAVDNLGNIYVW